MLKRIGLCALSLALALCFAVNPFARAQRAYAVVPVAAAAGAALCTFLGACGIAVTAGVVGANADGDDASIYQNFADFASGNKNAQTIADSLSSAIQSDAKAASDWASVSAQYGGSLLNYVTSGAWLDSTLNQWGSSGTVSLGAGLLGLAGCALTAALSTWMNGLSSTSSAPTVGDFGVYNCSSVMDVLGIARDKGYLSSSAYDNCVKTYGQDYDGIKSHQFYIALANKFYTTFYWSSNPPVGNVKLVFGSASSHSNAHIEATFPAGTTFGCVDTSGNGFLNRNAWVQSSSTNADGSVKLSGSLVDHYDGYYFTPYGVDALQMTPVVRIRVLDQSQAGALGSRLPVASNGDISKGDLGTVKVNGLDRAKVSGSSATSGSAKYATHTGTLDKATSDKVRKGQKVDRATATVDVGSGDGVKNVPLDSDMSGTSLDKAGTSQTTDEGAKKLEDLLEQYPELVRDLNDYVTTFPQLQKKIEDYINGTPAQQKQITDGLEQVLSNQKSITDNVTGVPALIKRIDDYIMRDTATAEANTQTLNNVNQQVGDLAAQEAEVLRQATEIVNQARANADASEANTQTLNNVNQQVGDLAAQEAEVLRQATEIVNQARANADASEAIRKVVAGEQNAPWSTSLANIDTNTANALEAVRQWNGDTGKIVTAVQQLSDEAEDDGDSSSKITVKKLLRRTNTTVETYLPEITKITPAIQQVQPELERATKEVTGIKQLLADVSTLTEQKVQTQALEQALGISQSVLTGVTTLVDTDASVLDKASTIAQVLERIFPPDDGSDDDDPPDGEDFERAMEPMTHVFPLSAPFDLQRIVNKMSGSETHVIKADLSVISKGWVVTYDLSDWDGAIKVIRGFELIVFAVGLTLITRNIVAG